MGEDWRGGGQVSAEEGLEGMATVGLGRWGLPPPFPLQGVVMFVDEGSGGCGERWVGVETAGEEGWGMRTTFQPRQERGVQAIAVCCSTVDAT